MNIHHSRSQCKYIESKRHKRDWNVETEDEREEDTTIGEKIIGRWL